MRASVGRRGAAGSTFDHVAREAGVSRGLLHYYFGSKERLLAEVVRSDCDERIRVMDERLAEAGSVDEIVQALVRGLEDFVEDDPGTQAVIYEMLSASRRSEEIRVELAELYRRWRAHLAEALREKERQGVVTLSTDAEAVASLLFALGDGL
ncbi:MAG TPA: TetR family transcriptional regulator, partial [Thermoleophilaceae bacterium]|nr:TetR family transcriptional regulator [Thermoleophilaceae bacterium]